MADGIASLAAGAASVVIVLAICAYRGARAPRAWGWALVLTLALTLMFGMLALAKPARAGAGATDLAIAAR